MGLMVDINEDIFAGTPIYTHPMNFFRYSKKAVPAHDIYSLAISLVQIESYRKNDPIYLFKEYKNKDIQ